MHNLPVYTDITHGNRQMTVIRKVEGDIWVSGWVGQGLIVDEGRRDGNPLEGKVS